MDYAWPGILFVIFAKDLKYRCFLQSSHLTEKKCCAVEKGAILADNRSWNRKGGKNPVASSTSSSRSRRSEL
jgi:hypothetical protein